MATCSLTSVRGAIPKPGLVGGGLRKELGPRSFAMVSNRRELCSHAKLVSQFWSTDSRRGLVMKRRLTILRPGSHPVVVRTLSKHLFVTLD